MVVIFLGKLYNIVRGGEFVRNETLRRLIGKNSYYYLTKFQKIEDTNTKVSFNVSGFLFSYFWLSYRKMHKEAIIAFVLTVICNSVQPTSGLILSILIGAFGNYMYYKHLTNHYEYMQTLDSVKQEAFIDAVGGTSWKWILIYWAITISFFMLAISSLLLIL
ncbi:MAG: hypothetical protein ATN36_01045 [Epulopiscium sp. Nele67-Bin005]|nr:MAG: hypothetical protein ATN36_01045 [Epulopiscium sp. Nele67-Bin005]